MIDLALLESVGHVHEFRLDGQVSPLSELRKGGVRGRSRPMAGWLMTYGKLGPDGGVVPTVDRDGQIAEVAGELGRIDWTDYAKGGRWNDTHDEAVIVGLPSELEFHDGTTELSKAHGKVGFWTSGHLFDRHDPGSWAGLGRTPSDHEFERADHFWGLAHLLKGTPRPIALSAHGLMALSPCKSRIIFAKVSQAAVCEVPKNPDATLEPMLMSWKGTPLEIMRKGMVGRSPCRTCSCPPGACEGLLRKAGTTSATASGVVPEDLEGGHPKIESPLQAPPAGSAEQYEALVARIMARFMVTRADAVRFIALYIESRRPAQGKAA